MEWYKNWQFWTVVISGIALAVSLYPLLKVRFQKGKLQIEKYRTFFVTHRVGTPNINLNIAFKNVGGSSLTVKAVNLQITRDKETSFNLIGNGYLITPNDQQFVMLTPFYLKGGDSWSHVINFQELWSRKTQQKYRVIESKIRDHIQTELRETPPEPGKLVEAKSEDVEAITAFFNDNFKWENGEYEVKISVIGETNKEIASDSFMFTIFESESYELASYKDDLKYGYGVHLIPAIRVHGLNIDITQ